MLDLVLLAALLHELDGLGARQLEGRELEVLLHDLLHLVLDGGQVVVGDLGALGKVDVVVEAVLGGGAIGKVGLGVQALDGLRHDVGGGVADDVRDLVLRQLGYVPVVVERFHMMLPPMDVRCAIGWRRLDNEEQRTRPPLSGASGRETAWTTQGLPGADHAYWM